MPTHIRTRFTPQELQTATLSQPFAFSKGCPLMRMTGNPWGEPSDMATMLFDLHTDSGQLHPIHDPDQEAILSTSLQTLE